MHCYISKINSTLKGESPDLKYKYYVSVIHNSAFESTFRALGISPVKGVTPNTTLTLPYFVVQAMLQEFPDPDEVYIEDDGKFGKTIFISAETCQVISILGTASIYLLVNL